MNQLVIERTFDAPIETLWEAWTDESLLKRWWAPPGMHCSSIKANVTEGGRFDYCFKMNEGEGEFWGRGIYTKLESPHTLVYLDSFTDAEGNDVPPSHYGIEGADVVETQVEVSLTEVDGKTQLKLVGENPYAEEMTKEVTDGWNGMLDNLEKLLQEN